MIEFRWAMQSELPAAAVFLSRVIAADDRYISHGEVQTGLSPDGVHWASDLSERIAQDMADLGDDRSVALAVAGEDIVGAAIMLWVHTPRVSYCVLEDLAVDLAHRSGGTGTKLVALVEEQARARGMGSMFLESGLRNQVAHRFFERHGFSAMSKVFSKRL